MKIMTTDSSATTREDTPHSIQIPYGDQPSRTTTIVTALTRRARAVLNDNSIDAQSRTIIRYALETNDPWLARLVRQVDAGERITEPFDFSQTPDSGEESEEEINALAEIICRAGNECSAALLVLMATLENSTHPRLLANAAKHFAFTRCGDLNLYRMVGDQIARINEEVCVS
jgi:hypothetical protein